ncbi:MAG: hypothetical protein H7039_15485 [Bryobacteraceae bacterium]|nr:hypothetical protein [Bryobacteraceae bacterium]
MTGNLSCKPAQIATLLVLSLTTAVFAQESKSLAQQVGVYHWGGKHASGYSSGIRDLTSLNARIVRLTISPQLHRDYNQGPACLPNFTLSGALDNPDLLSALAHPQLEVIMITTYDGAGFGDCFTHPYLNPEWYTPGNTERIVSEYSEFVHRLHVLLQGTGKRLILSNWEGDNALYCGQAYSYLHSDVFREQCLAAYPLAYGGNRGPQDSVKGMVLWLKARYLGMTSGRERAKLSGLTGVQVESAIEFCSLSMLRSHGLQSVLYDVLPSVAFDYISYSAYESLTAADPASALRADLNRIQMLTGTKRIILGEVGFSRSRLGDRQIEAIHKVTNAAIEWGVPYIILWNLYDQDVENDYGLFDLEGRISTLGIEYSRMLSLESK